LKYVDLFDFPVLDAMKVSHLFLYAALALLNVAYCSRLHHHAKRHRVQNSEDVDSPVMVSATLNSDDATDSAPSELPYCFSWEPCQFVFTKKNPKDNMPVRKTIPSWCRCDASQKCVLVEYDRRRKMDVHKCADEEQPMSISVRHLRSRGGGDQWIFDMPLHRNNARRSNDDNDSVDS